MKNESTQMVTRTMDDLKQGLSPETLAQIEALKSMPDREIDYSDIPQLPADFMRRARPIAEVFPKLAAAMKEVREHLAHEEAKKKVILPATVDARSIRIRLGFSQEQFADRFGLNVNTLRRWESGQRSPEPSARALLLVIAHSPDTVTAALQNVPPQTAAPSPAKQGRPRKTKPAA